jgi:hypothetical protein
MAAARAFVSALIQHMSDCAFFTIHMQISPGRNDGTRCLRGHSRDFHTHYVLVDAEDDDEGTKPLLYWTNNGGPGASSLFPSYRYE